MKILYISATFPRVKEGSTIYTDLAEEIVKEGHLITIVVAEEKRKSSKTFIDRERNLNILRVKTGNVFDVGFIEKGITFLLMPHILKRAIKTHLSDQEFDLILFESPPVTMSSVVNWAMKHFKSPSYLMLKDVFPQNALDLGILKKSHPAYWYFKRKEKKLYDTASLIGTMSKANQDYIIKHNPKIDSNKVKIFPNTKKINLEIEKRKNDFRKMYDIPTNSVLAIYGGNMGKPQGLGFLCEVLESNKYNNAVFFLLVGRGNEKWRVIEFVKDNNITNALILDSLHRDEYEEMLEEADIGLVFLDKRFTIPNFPSRVLSYFEKSIPILAAIDKNTDFGQMLRESRSGDFSLSGDINDFNEKLSLFVENPDLRVKMGQSGYEYLLDNYDVKLSVKLLEKHSSSVL